MSEYCAIFVFYIKCGSMAFRRVNISLRGVTTVKISSLHEIYVAIYSYIIAA